MTVAQRLEFARKKRGFSQRRLAKLADVSGAYVQHVETSRIKSPGNAQIEKLALALSVGVEWLAFGSGRSPRWGKGAA